MRVLLKLRLESSPDAAWAAIRAPKGMRDVSRPFTTFGSLEPDGFPSFWSPGEHRVLLRAFGLIPIGEQVINISFEERDDGVRIMRDYGRGVSGPLALVRSWRHSIAISGTPGGTTLYRDQLRFEAGALTPALWLGYWAFWQWRGRRIRRLARTWQPRVPLIA
ncbi:MAG: hypothetical protein JWM49_1827 [Microbacteriaceae bacterium]|jgi:hypothetical protein|nr:hypothetical protein [Microbacteriaceae bacterium]